MQNNRVYILAIESSCDDTSVAVLCNDVVLSNIVASQKIHEQYGGVVPELASRDHEKNLVPVVMEALKVANIKLVEINAIAVTYGPGLMGSLLVGLSFAKSLALALNIPLIAVNHMQAHVLAHFIRNPAEQQAKLDFPFLCLTVSGGHTQLIMVKDYFDFNLIGETTDDAVGEAFDKAAKILGLAYPGGPLIDRFAKNGNANKYSFPKAKVGGYDFSFSGIKTSFLYFIRDQVKVDNDFVEKNIEDICASYQNHLINTLLENTAKAMEEYGIRTLALAGGVSANSCLRSKVNELCESKNWSAKIPPFEYCTDNAAMIGIAAYFKFLKKEFENLSIIPNVNIHI
ncbi:MAG: tRNA (adenosine(37)-N6)-threonylcarbamoyltransferase complex transferase subunit TsaD [Sphingobacteriaceae bacterium]|nr:tRNA (adenosine(37)-N6)-threonylcarbamoyltransferase complex transferase subunit TsaD [Sphingobacteriaceae bacterium]